MCRIPKVVVIAPAEQHLEMRKALSSLEYDVVATVESFEEAASISATVAVCLDPDDDVLERLRRAGLKTVAVSDGADPLEADMVLAPGEIGAFKSRIWELFR